MLQHWQGCNAYIDAGSAYIQYIVEIKLLIGKQVSIQYYTDAIREHAITHHMHVFMHTVPYLHVIPQNSPNYDAVNRITVIYRKNESVN